MNAPQWSTGHPPGTCTWRHDCGPVTTHVIEWPRWRVEGVEWFRTYACGRIAGRIRAHQLLVGTVVEVREVGEGNW